MSARTRIEWTDRTWNPLLGCSKTSPGCRNCYAIRQVHRMAHNPNAKIAAANAGLVTLDGKNWTGEVRFLPERLLAPYFWRKPQRIFVNSLSDPFHSSVRFEDLRSLWAVMGCCGRHCYQILTKRPSRMLEFLRWLKRQDEADIGTDDWMPAANIWLGCSVEDQPRAVELHDAMAAIAAMGWPTFVSYEPALGQVQWSGWSFLRWLISGGESGPSARPSHPDWHRAARDFCLANGIPYYFKQWGEWVPCGPLEADPSFAGGEAFEAVGSGRASVLCLKTRRFKRFVDGQIMERVRKKRAGRLLDGRVWSELPEVDP